MDFRHLRTFVTIAEHGTVSKAAERLRVAQPALSRQIQDLEAELGIKLFDRFRQRLVLTTEGRLLLTDCRFALNAIGALGERAQLLRRPDAGILKVAATPQTIDGVLSLFLARYARSHPNVHVELIEAFGAELLGTLERGEAHVVISTAGGISTSHQSFDPIWLPPLEFVAACHPATDIGNAPSIDVRRLGSHPLLLLDRSFAVRSAFDAACRVAEFKPNVSFQSRTPHTLLALAETGRGIAIVPSVLPTHRYKLRVVRLTYRNKPLREAYAIVLDRRRSLPPAADEFCRLLVSYVREVFPISKPSAPTSDAGRSKRRSKARTVPRRS